MYVCSHRLSYLKTLEEHMYHQHDQIHTKKKTRKTRYDDKKHWTAKCVPFLSLSFFFCLYSYKQTKQEGKCKYNIISFVINANPIFFPPIILSSPFVFLPSVIIFGHLKSLDKRCEVMDITITYGCTKTYFYMSEIFKKKICFFVYSSNSIILFIIVTMFHKLYIFFLKCRGCLFLCKACFFWLLLTLGRGYVHCNMALYVRPIYIRLSEAPQLGSIYT